MTRIGSHHLGLQSLPIPVRQSHTRELPIDLERRQEVREWEIGSVGGAEDVVDLVEIWFREGFLGGHDELIRTEGQAVVFLARGVGEDDAFRTEGFDELDRQVYRTKPRSAPRSPESE